LVRHRIASYDQQSQRYVSSSQFEYVTPDKIAKNADAKTLFDNTMQDLQKTYDQLIELGIAKEDARAVLPNACATRLIVTMNARSLFHFFGLRCCVRAQSEIRQMANEMLKLCKEVAPQIFANAGANCEQLGYCPECDMCCGRAPTIHKLLEIYQEHKGDK
jgi:thymidylate synthase (FAD)